MIHPRKATLLLALLLLPPQLHAAPQQFEIDLKELDRQKPAPSKPPRRRIPESSAKKAPGKKEPAAKKKESAKGAHAAKKTPKAGGDFVRYTVQPGDHIFKILMVRFGLSNEAAERLIPEIVELNGIRNIKALEVGRTLLIPAGALREQAPKQTGKEKEKPVRQKKVRAAKPEEAAPGAPEPAPAEAPGTAEPAAAAPRAPEPAVPAAPKAVPAPAAPVPAQKPTPAPAPQPAPAAKPATEPVPVPVPKPAPAPMPLKVAPPAAAAPAVPVLPPAITWICPVGQHDAGTIVDSLLNAIAATWSRNKIIQSGQGAATPFSIRVDRYFEYKGGRYIVSIGERDPYNYTLIRILETAGYRVLMLTGKEDFKTVSERLFALAGIAPDFGSHALQEGRQAAGFLVRQEDAGGRQVLITDAPPSSGYQWVLPPGCGAR